MRTVESILISLIESRLKNIPPEIDASDLTEEVYKELFNLSKKHDLSHLLAESLIKYGYLKQDDFAYKPFYNSLIMAISRYERLNGQLNEITELFDANSIDYILLKGAVLRELYPKPYYRTSCDIDILIREKDLKKADELVLSLGTYVSFMKTSHDYSYKLEGGIPLELHFNLIETDKKVEKLLSSVWESSLKCGKNCYQMSNENFILYFVSHIAKHFCEGGCGIRPFIDLFFIKDLSVDKPLLDETLKKAGLYKFYYQSLKLCEFWFNNGEGNEVLSTTERFIVNGGTFGNANTSVSLDNARYGKKKFLLKRIFLPYRNLIILYPKAKCKILVPFYQVLRWIKIIFNKKSKKRIAEKLNANHNLTQKEIDSLVKMCESLGIKE